MKAGRIAALLLFLLLLTACGREPEGPDIPPEAETERNLEPDAADAEAMARVLSANRILLRDDALYCYDFDGDWAPVLARYTWKDGKLSDFRVLARGCVPEYLCWLDGWLCYIDRGSGALERVPEQGGARERMREGPCRCLTQRDGLLYYCDGEGRFLALNMASGVDTLILSGPCSFAYPLETGILYREADSGRILLRREDGSLLSLAPEGASPPLLLADRLWYSRDGSLVGRSLSGGEDLLYALPEHDGDLELLPTAEGLLLRGIRDQNGPIQWEGPPDGPFRELPPPGYRICDWLGDGLRVDTIYEPDGRIRCYLLRDETGTELSFLAGKIQ